MSRLGNCMECKDFKPIKAKSMCQNCWHKFKRKNHPEFFLRTRYTEVKQRCTNPNNGQSQYYLGLPICSQSEFLTKFRNDSLFIKLFKEWQLSGWDNKYCPSIDRTDSSKGYTLDNISIMTHSSNCLKDQIKQKVYVYSKDKSKLLFEFVSQSEASRVLNIPQANIWKVIVGERKSAGGYYFVGGEYGKS